jgi:hypothetical protein
MLRSITLTAVTAVGLLSPLATATPAEAHPPFHEDHEFIAHRRFHCEFEVMYRRCDHEPWRCYGEYRSHEYAERVACHLRERGFEVYIR